MKPLAFIVRTLAQQLYNAAQREQKNFPGIFSQNRRWRDLPSESVAVWDAVAVEAFKRLCPPQKTYEQPQRKNPSL